MTKIFVIDDSLAVRSGFRKLFKEMDDITLIGDACNPIDAFEVFKKVGLPDLFILDLEMPRMDGLTFLKQLNEQRPTPVLICSSFVSLGSSALIDAMRLGAADIIEKPKSNLGDLFITYKEDVLQKIRTVAKAKIHYKNDIIANKQKVEKVLPQSIPSAQVIAIGSSTGGIQVLEEIFTHLKSTHLGIIVVQHIPKEFSASLAARLDDLCVHSIVKEAKEGDVVMNNTIYIAPGARHLEVEKQGLQYILRLKDFPKVNSHRPSVNVLFNSIAKNFKANATGFILTGMGDDGAIGLKKMQEAGANTYVQNEKTSTVYGMPKVAMDMGAAQKALSIYEIIQVINEA
jgi:two-component system, chemotaxis family, protein-glutamate methylesterase/glutaminase